MAASRVFGVVTDRVGATQPGVLIEAIQSGTVVDAATSSSDGSFNLEVSDGIYDVRLTPPSGSAYRVTLLTGVTLEAATPLNVVLARTSAVVTIQGTLTARIGGDVVPLSSPALSFSPIDPNVPYSVVEDVTGGRFEVTLVEGARYRLSGPLCCSAADFGLAGVDVVADGSSTIDIQLTFARLNVNVRTTTGAPVSGGKLLVNAYSAAQSAYERIDVRLGADGGAVIDVLRDSTTDEYLSLADNFRVPVDIPDVSGDATLEVVVRSSSVKRGYFFLESPTGASNAYRYGDLRLTPDDPALSLTDARWYWDSGPSMRLFEGVGYTATGAACCTSVGSDVDVKDWPVEFSPDDGTFAVRVPIVDVKLIPTDAAGNLLIGARIRTSMSLTSASGGRARVRWFGVPIPTGGLVTSAPAGAQFTDTVVTLASGVEVPVTPAPIAGPGDVTFVVNDPNLRSGHIYFGDGPDRIEPNNLSLEFVPTNPSIPTSRVTATGTGFSASLVAGVPYRVTGTAGFADDSSIFLENWPVTMTGDGEVVIAVAGERLTVRVRDPRGVPMAGARLLVRLHAYDPAHAIRTIYTVLDGDGEASVLVPRGWRRDGENRVSQAGAWIYAQPIAGVEPAGLLSLTALRATPVKVTIGTSRAGVATPAADGRVSLRVPGGGFPFNDADLPFPSGGRTFDLFDTVEYEATANLRVTPTTTLNLRRRFTVDASAPQVDLSMPVSDVTFSLRRADGTPISGGRLDGIVDQSTNHGFGLSMNQTFDSSGRLSVPVPTGGQLAYVRVFLPNGPLIPIIVPRIVGPTGIIIVYHPDSGAVDVVPDSTPPTVVASLDPSRPPNGWWRTPVTVTWSAVDPAPSSGVPVQPVPTIVTADGRDQVIRSPEVCDGGGNCAIGSTTLSIDQSGPRVSITGASDGEVVGAGQLGGLGCSATDDLSGLDGQCTLEATPGTTVPGGRRYGLRAEAFDVAGNRTSVTADIVVADASLSIDGPTQGSEGSTIALTARSDVDTSTVEWDVQGDGRFDDGIGARIAVVLSDGPATLRVRARRGSVVAEHTIVVTNTAPAVSWAVEPQMANDGGVVARLRATDVPADEAAGFEYAIRCDPTAPYTFGASPEASCRVTPGVARSIITGFVRDRDGAVGSIEATVDARSFTVTVTAPRSVREGVRIVRLTTDAATPFSAEWDFDGDGAFDDLAETATEGQLRARWTVPDDRTGPVRIGVRVTDAAGRTAEFRTTPIAIVNAAPSGVLPRVIAGGDLATVVVQRVADAVGDSVVVDVRCSGDTDWRPAVVVGSRATGICRPGSGTTTILEARFMDDQGAAQIVRRPVDVKVLAVELTASVGGRPTMTAPAARTVLLSARASGGIGTVSYRWEILWDHDHDGSATVQVTSTSRTVRFVVPRGVPGSVHARVVVSTTTASIRDSLDLEIT